MMAVGTLKSADKWTGKEKNKTNRFRVLGEVRFEQFWAMQPLHDTLLRAGPAVLGTYPVFDMAADNTNADAHAIACFECFATIGASKYWLISASAT